MGTQSTWGVRARLLKRLAVALVSEVT